MAEEACIVSVAGGLELAQHRHDRDDVWSLANRPPEIEFHIRNAELPPGALRHVLDPYPQA